MESFVAAVSNVINNSMIGVLIDGVPGRPVEALAFDNIRTALCREAAEAAKCFPVKETA